MLQEPGDRVDQPLQPPSAHEAPLSLVDDTRTLYGKKHGEEQYDDQYEWDQAVHREYIRRLKEQEREARAKVLEAIRRRGERILGKEEEKRRTREAEEELRVKKEQEDLEYEQRWQLATKLAEMRRAPEERRKSLTRVEFLDVVRRE